MLPGRTLVKKSAPTPAKGEGEGEGKEEGEEEGSPKMPRLQSKSLTCKCYLHAVHITILCTAHECCTSSADFVPVERVEQRKVDGFTHIAKSMVYLRIILISTL